MRCGILLCFSMAAAALLVVSTARVRVDRRRNVEGGHRPTPFRVAVDGADFFRQLRESLMAPKPFGLDEGRGYHGEMGAVGKMG